MSCLKQVMEMFELEDMQEFEFNETSNYGYTYRFNLKENAIEYTLPSIKGWERGDLIYKNLIIGHRTIKREWKPRDGDEYYIPDLLGKSLYMQDTWNWVEDKWRDLLVKRCIVFQTKEEAIECAKKMLEAIK